MLFDPSLQRTLPMLVCNPFNVRGLVALVLMVTPFVPVGEKVDCPLAMNEPLAVAAPVTVRPLLTVVVPVVAPRLSAVEAPPMLTDVATVLKILAVVAVVVREPPLSAKLPEEVMLPVRVDVPSMVKLPLV